MSLAVTLVLAAGLSAPAFARQPAPPCAIAGTVSGPDGALLPGAVIAVLDADRGDSRRAVTDDRGGYRVSRLLPGRYTVSARLDGFEIRTIDDVRLDTGTRKVDFTLTLAALSEAVTVIAQVPADSFEATKVRESGARDLGEALGDLPGVWKVRRAAIANDPVVRGYQGENLNVLIDGTRLYGACPNNMDHAAFHVDFAEVDRVEVAKGPFDLRNQGGLGGSVNVVTRAPAEGFHFAPAISAGSYRYVNPSTTFSYGTPAAAVLGGYSFRSSAPYTDGSGRLFTGSANYRASARDLEAFRVHTAWGRADLRPRQSQGVRASYTAQRAGLVTYPYLLMDATADSADRVNVAWTIDRPDATASRFRVQGYWNQVRHDMTDQYRTSSINTPRGYSMATAARTDTRGAKAEIALAGLSTGFEFYRRWWRASTTMSGMKYMPQASIPDVVANSAGAYVEYERAFSSALTVDIGGRVDRAGTAADAALAATYLYAAYHQTRATSATETHPSAKARVSWRAGDALIVSGGVGRTVRVPDPQERFFGLRRAGTDWVGNPLLKAAVNTGLDLSATYRRHAVSVSVSGYHDRLSNFIAVYQQARLDAVPGVMNQVARSYVNLDAAISGFEVDGAWTVRDRLVLAFDGSSLRGVRRGAPAARVSSPNLAEMPPARARVRLRYEVAGERRSTFAEVEGAAVARQDRVDLELGERPTPGYAIVNARAGVSYGRLRLVVGIANLLDRYYVEYLSYQRDPFRSGAIVAEPGRNLYVTATARF